MRKAMKIIKIFISIILMSMLIACQVTPRYALVIGNAKYEGDSNMISELPNPINDASDMKKALEKIGFTVIYRENVANREDMEAAVDQFVEQLQLQEESVGLFYYSGHGIQVDRKNYLIPTKVSISTPQEVQNNAMNANYVFDEIKKEVKNGGVNIIILDACRNPYFFLPNIIKGSKAVSIFKPGLTEMKAPSGSIIIYSTAPDKEANGGKKNSLFAKYLLKEIKEDACKPIYDILKNIGTEVYNKTINDNNLKKQEPWINGSLSILSSYRLCTKPPGVTYNP
jgi:uncharacterized caspase-like protein